MEEHSRLGTVRDHEAEALVVELIERLELHGTHAARQEQELEALRVQRDLLEAELEHATAVVARLSRQLLEAERRLAAQPLSLGERIRRRSAA